MLRRWLRVARPDDWTGMLARFGSAFVGGVLVLVALLVRFPDRWQQLEIPIIGEVEGRFWTLVLRLCALLAAVILARWVRTIAFALLPDSPVLLFGRTLRVRRGTWVQVIRARDVAEIVVDDRHDGEVFVLVLDDGQEVDLCPIEWHGAERIYARLQRRIRVKRRLARQAERRARRAARAQKDARVPETS